MNAILDYLIDVCVATASQVFILLGPGLVLAFILYFLSETIRKQSQVLFGWKFWVYFTAPGTILHELGHVVFAVLFGHKITELNLFGPDPVTGTLGYVSHAYNERNLYHRIGNFFIGIGPVILGSVVLFFSSRFLMGAALFNSLNGLSFDTVGINSLESFRLLLTRIGERSLRVILSLARVEHLGRWQFYLFLYLVFAIGAHLKLSPEDLKGALDGFLILVGTVLLFNLCTLWMGDFFTRSVVWISRTYSVFYSLMVFTIILNILFAVLLLIFGLVRKMIKR